MDISAERGKKAHLFTISFLLSIVYFCEVAEQCTFEKMWNPQLTLSFCTVENWAGLLWIVNIPYIVNMDDDPDYKSGHFS